MTACWLTAPNFTAWRTSRSRASPCWTASCPRCPSPTANAVAAVYTTDDYGDPEMQSHWAKVGDTVHLRYVEEWEYYYQDTGEVVPPDEVDAAMPAGAASARAPRPTAM